MRRTDSSYSGLNSADLKDLAAQYLTETGILGIRPRFIARDFGLEGFPDIFAFGCSRSIQIKVITSREELELHQRSSRVTFPETDCAQIRAYFCEVWVIEKYMVQGGWGLYSVMPDGKIREDIRPSNQHASLEMEHRVISAMMEATSFPHNICISLKY